MRQLEKALFDLAERAEALPLDVLVYRIETQLALEGALPAETDHTEPEANAHTVRAAIMQAPTQSETTQPRSNIPRLRGRAAWAFAIAFVLVVVAVGIAAVALRNNNPPVADEPAPPTTVADTPEAAAAPPVALPGPGEPWDLLFLAFDLPMGFDIPQMYADRAEQDLGVEINLHGPLGSATDPWTLLEHIEGGRYPDMSDPIRQAEIIVLQVPPSDWGTDPRHHRSVGTAIDTDQLSCRYIAATGPTPPEPTTAEYWQPYREALDAIYTEIWTLREGLPTVLIASDTHDAYIGMQQEAGIASQCRAWQEASSNVAAEAAADHGAVMVSIYDILNGTGHDVDPVAMGYVGGSQQFVRWPNEVGGEMVLEALAAVGFEPWPMP